MQYSLRDGSGRKANAFKVISFKDGTKVGVFQGSRGENPGLDIIVKYQQPGNAVRTPQHLHWAIDILIKKEHDKILTKKFVKYLLDMWTKVKPFSSKNEQQKCELTCCSEDSLLQFSSLNNYGEYTVEFICCIMELIMIQEKTGLSTAFMFKGLLEAIYNDKDIFSIVSKASYKGR